MLSRKFISDKQQASRSRRASVRANKIRVQTSSKQRKPRHIDGSSASRRMRRGRASRGKWKLAVECAKKHHGPS